MPASKATMTGKSGPNMAVNAMNLTDLTSFNLDLAKKVLSTHSEKGDQEFDAATIATLTCTISNGVATIVVS
jgi:hypothetical protein